MILKNKTSKARKFFSSLFKKEKRFGEAPPLARSIEMLNPVIGFTEGYQVDDMSIVKRILDAYGKSCGIIKSSENSMWHGIFHHHHQELHEIFLKQNYKQASEILKNPGNSELFYGIDDLTSSFQHYLRSDKEKAKYHAAMCLDGLIRFAEAVGAVKLYHPESIDKAQTIWTTDLLIEMIEQFFGNRLLIPNPFPDERGVCSSRGIISYRVPQALYQAWRIKKLLKDVEQPRVLEIGAGIGRTAYYARHFGIKNYTIVDLPFTAISSGYFLARTLGEENLLLHGEESFQREEKIKILTPTDFLNSDQEYDLIINVDSLTEMDRKSAIDYLNKIKLNKLFLSINHEGNPFTVHEFLRDSEIQVERYPYWMRNGYVEEIVRMKK